MPLNIATALGTGLSGVVQGATAGRRLSQRDEELRRRKQQLDDIASFRQQEFDYRRSIDERAFKRQGEEDERRRYYEEQEALRNGYRPFGHEGPLLPDGRFAGGEPQAAAEPPQSGGHDFSLLFPDKQSPIPGLDYVNIHAVKMEDPEYAAAFRDATPTEQLKQLEADSREADAMWMSQAPGYIDQKANQYAPYFEDEADVQAFQAARQQARTADDYAALNEALEQAKRHYIGVQVDEGQKASLLKELQPRVAQATWLPPAKRAEVGEMMGRLEHDVSLSQEERTVLAGEIEIELNQNVQAAIQSKFLPSVLSAVLGNLGGGQSSVAGPAQAPPAPAPSGGNAAISPQLQRELRIDEREKSGQAQAAPQFAAGDKPPEWFRSPTNAREGKNLKKRGPNWKKVQAIPDVASLTQQILEVADAAEDNATARKEIERLLEPHGLKWTPVVRRMLQEAMREAAQG